MRKEITDILEKTYNNLILRRTTVPLLLSNPGTGKSTIIKQFAESKGVKMVKITLSQRMPNEVVGMLMPDTKTGKMVAFNRNNMHYSFYRAPVASIRLRASLH